MAMCVGFADPGARMSAILLARVFYRVGIARLADPQPYSGFVAAATKSSAAKKISRLPTVFAKSYPLFAFNRSSTSRDTVAT
jgi:hypothetical protein